jgi:glutamate carboxypeptidase
MRAGSVNPYLVRSPCCAVTSDKGSEFVTDPIALSATLVAALIIGLPFVQSSATPSAEERALVTLVDAHNAEALALLERVVNINSGTQNLEGVREVGRVFAAELEALGFKTRWIDGSAFKRAGHLVAEHPGTGPRILLIGHLDTVFEKDSPFQKFERVDERTGRGPGIIDMKGGDVVMISALKALKGAGTLASMNLVVFMTGDEEDSGDPLNVARAALVDAAEGADIAIGFENGPGDPKLGVTARRGTTGWQVTVTGKPAHSSQIFREDIGYGAVYEMARVINGFREEMAGEAHLTFNPGVLLGGTSVDFDPVQLRGSAFGKTNVIAEHATASGDLRALSAEQFQKARQTMEAIVAKSLPGTHAAITFDEGYPAMAPTEGNTRLLAMYDQASRDLGFGTVTAVSPDRAGAADVSFVAGKIKTIIDGVGLMGRDDHTAKETADLTTLPSQTKRMAVLLHRIHKAGGVR